MRLPFGLGAYFDPALWRVGPSPTPLDERDPEFIRRELPRLAFWVERYHQTIVEAWERVPDGAALVVGNHNGGAMAPDMFALMVAQWKRRGVDEPAYGLMHDFVFMVPPFSGYLSRLGAVPARPDHGIELLGRGAKVLVYPGGDLDAFKPFARRHEIVFGRRSGFVKIALRARAPILPVVSVGAHESFFVLTDGAEFARRSGWKRLTRVEVMPVIAGLPWGLWVGVGGYVPLPVRIRLRVLDPIAWPDLGPDAADDEAVVWRCRERVREAMQAAMDEMVSEGGFGLRLGRRRPAGGRLHAPAR